VIAALLISAGFASPAESQQVVVQADTGVPPQGEPPIQADSEEARGREQRILRQVIFRDRVAQSTLDGAEAAFRSGDAPRAVGLLQQILDQQGDHFVWIERERRLVSARHRALGLLSVADAKTRALYDWAYAQEAKRLLDTGIAARDPALVADVSRRFFHTASGFEATDWLATRWLDRGEYALAARAWALLAADVQHCSRINETIRRKADVANQLLTRNAGPSPWYVPRTSDIRTAEISAVDDRATDSEEAPPPKAIQVVAAFEAGQPNSPVRSALPYMNPAWRRPLAEAKRPIIDGAVRRWQITQQRDDKGAVAVHSAVVAGSAIAFRSYEGISAVDGATGRSLWNYTAGTSFLRAWTEAALTGASAGDPGSNDPALDAMMSSYAGNSILGTITTDGRRIFAIDSMDIRPRQSAPPAEEPGEPHDGSQRVSRNANRLVALDIYAPAFDGAGSAKPVWAVGGSVGTSHWFYRMDANDDGRVTQAEFLGSPEDFRKLDRNGDGAIDKSESENPEVKIERHPLHGHFFLGPPLALDGRLYAVTEYDSQLNLVALSADTGAVLWIQGIGYVDRPIDEDPLRHTLACTPCYAAGVIVCPTQMGVLVGVDALDGALLWTYYYGDDDVTGPEGAWSFVSHRPYGNAGFPIAPLIDGDRVVILPRQSDWIHCVDLSTGRGIWKQPRNDAEFIAGAADGVVMIVGERLCRGISLSNGAARWSARRGAAAGCGLRVGTQYLLPLTENRIVAIDIRTGLRTGSSAAPESDWELAGAAGERDDSSHADSDPTESNERAPDATVEGQVSFADMPGNLAGGGSFIFSLGPREIAGYPRADVLLNEVNERLASSSRTTADLLLAADLELTLGNGHASKAYLSQIAEAGLPEDARQRRGRMMRAILYQELAASPEDTSAILHELEQLSHTRRQRGRFLQVKAAADVRRGDLNAVCDSARAFAALEISELLPSPTDSTHLISSRSWLSSTDEQLRRKLGDSAVKLVEARVMAEQEAVLKSADRAALERFLAVYSAWPEADAVRLRLASLLAGAGELERAELLLIQNQRSGGPTTRNAAERQLAHLWDRAGMPEEAAELLMELGSPQLDEFPAESLSRLAYKRLKEAEKPAGRVRITQSLWEHCDNDLADTYANAARPFVTRPMSPFQLIDRGSSMRAEISIVDRLSGTIIDTLRVPSPYSGSALAMVSQVGHFLPLGSRGSLHGISLLQHDLQKPLWTTSPRPIALDVDQALVGPSGPTFCAFQSHSHLFVVDPGTGKLLWQRTDLDPQSGLGGDPLRGIFGDDEVIVVLAADHLAYTVYRTATGEELRQGRLDNESRQTQDRRTFGRCLLYITADDTNHRMRIWDPVGDRLLYDQPIWDHPLWKETGEDEVAVVGAGGTLQIVDGRTGAVRIAVELAPKDVQNACQLAVFRDSARYYVNLQPMQSPPEPRYYNYFFGTDTVLPRVDLRGDVLAIDRRSGHLLWKRAFMQRTVLRTPSLHLPVLVMLSLVGDRMNGNHRSMLIEAVDANTGETLGLEDNKFPNRILQLTYDHDRRRVRLWGTRSVVDLDLAKPSDALAAEAAAH
jgi:outer membrane protein assembly factor BamB